MTPSIEQIEALPFFQTADPDLREAFKAHAQTMRFRAGAHIAMEGAECPGMAFVLNGVVRIYKLGESGREITLYRVRAGDSCILTASCIMNQQAFPAFIEAETDVAAAVIPSAVFRSWVGKFPFWQDYVFGLMSSRMASVMSTIEEVAFRRMDARLADHLLASGEDEIRATHQQIATDLGSSREVISRLLKDLEGRGLVETGRNLVTIRDRTGLEEAAGK